LVLTDTDTPPVAAVRADRTPTQPVHRLIEVTELGLPTARGEAEALASRLAAEATDKIRLYEAGLSSTRQRQWLEALRGKFINLVHETLVAGCAASRYDKQEGADPVTIWYNLGKEPTEWSWAEAFRERLGAPLGQLISIDIPHDQDSLSPEDWANRQQLNRATLRSLIDQYRPEVKA
jgi:hypothetical protein